MTALEIIDAITDYCEDCSALGDTEALKALKEALEHAAQASTLRNWGLSLRLGGDVDTGLEHEKQAAFSFERAEDKAKEADLRLSWKKK